MKLIKRSRIILILAAMLFSGTVFGQCETDIFLDECASYLGTYNYIKSFNVSATARKKAAPEFTYVFSKGSKYMLIVCDQAVTQGKMVVNLFDRDHNLIASTYDQANGTYYPHMIYTCSTTGVYYIQTAIQGAKNGCGMCILGFTKE